MKIKQKQVWQWRSLRPPKDFALEDMNWTLNPELMTEGQAKRYWSNIDTETKYEKLARYEKHAGPFEIDE